MIEVHLDHGYDLPEDEPTPELKKFHTDPMDIPWFRDAVEESWRVMEETPEQSRPEGFKK